MMFASPGEVRNCTKKIKSAESSISEGSTEDQRPREAEDGQTTHARIAERRNDKRP